MSYNFPAGCHTDRHCVNLDGPASFVKAEEWNSADCLRILRYNRVTLAWITAAGLAAAALLCMIQPQYFQSKSSLEVQTINENFLSFRDIYQMASPGVDSTGIYMQTQAEILQQDALIDLVARRLRLERQPEFMERSTFWGGLYHGTRRSSRSTGHDLVGALKQHLQVTPVRNSRIIEIVSESQDAKLAADIANTLAEVFISERTEERRREAQRTYDSLRLPLAELRRQIVQSEVKTVGLTVGPVQGANTLLAIHGPFKSEQDATLRFYQGMLQRLNDAAVAAVVLQGNIRLVSRARPAEYPYKPNVPLNLILGMVGGLILGSGIVMLKEQTNAVLRTSREAGKYLTVPELGAIPRFTNPVSKTAGLLQVRHDDQLEAGAGFEFQRSNLPETFRATLASILSSRDASDPPRTLVITSSLPSEGKTTVVSNLGVALTEVTGRVLLVDGDMRRPRLHQVFGQANSWGLSDILREKNNIEDLPVEALVKKTPVPNLYLLPSGPYTDNIFGLLYSGRLSRLLARFRRDFDYVLIDVPPCLEFTDARVAARFADKLLLVVRANLTARQTAQAAVRRLLMDGIPLMGVILNCCDPDQSELNGYMT